VDETGTRQFVTFWPSPLSERQAVGGHVPRSLHDQALNADDTDWPQILALYGLLERMTGNPVVTLNRAVAAAMADGPSAVLELLDAVDERLAGHYRLDAVRAHLLEMAGDGEAGAEALSRRR
jgi:predicted RNA polymerase sigma factor